MLIAVQRQRLFIFFLVLIFPMSIAMADVSGKPRIVDADTIWIGKTKIRLHGIDAPETRQECTDQNGRPYRCGVAATKALKSLVGAREVRCEGETRDRYKRLIAICYANNVNLNAEIVRLGWALAYRRYSRDYISAESEAQVAKRGIWAGAFQKPWKWRRTKR
jgi:endonuclease YncB( thermonuclease family)